MTISLRMNSLSSNSSIDDAIRMLPTLGKGALMANLDLKAAFRMVPVHAYYFDTCLPFGLRSAPF